MDKSIVIVTRSMFAGGAERVIAQLANYFVEQHIQCTLITIDNEKILYDLHPEIKIIPIGNKANKKVIDKFKRYKLVRKIVRKLNPSVVLSMPEDIGIYVIFALLGLHIPVYVSERNNPWVMPDVKVTRILRKVMYPFAKGIIFQTEMAKSYFPGSIQKKGIVLGNPVDASRIPVPYDGERERIIVGAGRLDAQKNFQLLISAFADFVKEQPNYKLYIYGEGRQRAELENLIKNFGISEKVQLPGRKSNLLELMNSAAMFVLSSDFEGLPNVLIEAMCMGMPVISTDCPSGGPKELIHDNVNGLLIPVGDREGLVASMRKLSNPMIANAMGAEALKIRSVLMSSQIFSNWENYLFRN